MNFSAVAAAAPPPTTDPKNDERVHYFESKYGQIVGWMTNGDKRFLVDWLPDAARTYPIQPMRIVEVGTFLGSTARGLIALSGGKIVCIDNWKDVHVTDPRKQWEDTLRKYFDLSANATLIEGDQKNVGEKWNEPIDLLLIDADHSYESAIADMRHFAEQVVPGGYCLVDDTDLPDVARAEREFFHNSAWDPVRVPTGSDQKLACWQRRVT